MLHNVFLVSLESSEEEGCMGFAFMAFGLEVQKFLNLE
jgi:hypothetical protein